MPPRPIRTGDTIHHRPSGEDWLVAFARNGEVCCCGWPESYADIDDCDLVEAGTDDERTALLEAMAKFTRGKHDARREYAIKTLADERKKTNGQETTDQNSQD